MSRGAKQATLDERIDSLEDLAHKLKLALWLAAALGLSVGGGITFLWARFSTENSRISQLAERVSVVERRAVELQNLLNPQSIRDQARQALKDEAPDVLKTGIEAIRKDIPKGIAVVRTEVVPMGQDGELKRCKGDDEIVVAVKVGSSQNAQLQCAKISFSF